MNKLWKYFSLVLSVIFRAPYAAFAIIVIFLLSYFFGYTYFTDIRGTDTLNALSYMMWFDKWWPRIPYWYPLQNGGVIPVWGYPFLAHYFVILVHRYFQISLINSMQIIGFLSVPLTAAGLYFFVALRLKNQTAGLIGAVLYILAPISWVWLFTWGFYAESISYIWIFPALIFYDIAFQSIFSRKFLSLGARISILLAVICMAFAFLTHPNAFFSSLAFIISYSIVVAIYKEKGWLNRVLKGLIPPAVIMVCSVLLLSFIIFDFLNYAKYTTAWRGGESLPQKLTEEQIKKLKEENDIFVTTPIEVVFGLKQLPPTDFRFGHNNIVVTPAVWIPALPGFILAAIYSPVVFGLGLPVVFTLLSFWQPQQAA